MGACSDHLECRQGGGALEEEEVAVEDNNASQRVPDDADTGDSTAVGTNQVQDEAGRAFVGEVEGAFGGAPWEG